MLLLISIFLFVVLAITLITFYNQQKNSKYYALRCKIDRQRIKACENAWKYKR
jgi:hypothetical protein